MEVRECRLEDDCSALIGSFKESKDSRLVIRGKEWEEGIDRVLTEGWGDSAQPLLFALKFVGLMVGSSGIEMRVVVQAENEEIVGGNLDLLFAEENFDSPLVRAIKSGFTDMRSKNIDLNKLIDGKILNDNISLEKSSVLRSLYFLLSYFEFTRTEAENIFRVLVFGITLKKGILRKNVDVGEFTFSSGLLYKLKNTLNISKNEIITMFSETRKEKVNERKEIVLQEAFNLLLKSLVSKLNQMLSSDSSSKVYLTCSNPGFSLYSMLYSHLNQAICLKEVLNYKHLLSVNALQTGKYSNKILNTLSFLMLLLGTKHSSLSHLEQILKAGEEIISFQDSTKLYSFIKCLEAPLKIGKTLIKPMIDIEKTFRQYFSTEKKRSFFLSAGEEIVFSLRAKLRRSARKQVYSVLQFECEPKGRFEFIEGILSQNMKKEDFIIGKQHVFCRSAIDFQPEDLENDAIFDQIFDSKSLDPVDYDSYFRYMEEQNYSIPKKEHFEQFCFNLKGSDWSIFDYSESENAIVLLQKAIRGCLTRKRLRIQLKESKKVLKIQRYVKEMLRRQKWRKLAFYLRKVRLIQLSYKRRFVILNRSAALIQRFLKRKKEMLAKKLEFRQAVKHQLEKQRKEAERKKKSIQAREELEAALKRMEDSSKNVSEEPSEDEKSAQSEEMVVIEHVAESRENSEEVNKNATENKKASEEALDSYGKKANTSRIKQKAKKRIENEQNRVIYKEESEIEYPKVIMDVHQFSTKFKGKTPTVVQRMEMDNLRRKARLVKQEMELKPEKKKVKGHIGTFLERNKQYTLKKQALIFHDLEDRMPLNKPKSKGNNRDIEDLFVVL